MTSLSTLSTAHIGQSQPEAGQALPAGTSAQVSQAKTVHDVGICILSHFLHLVELCHTNHGSGC